MTSSTPLRFKIKMAPPAGAHEAGSGRICCRANDDGPSADHSQHGHWRFGCTTMAFHFRTAGAAGLMRWARLAMPIFSFRALPQIVAQQSRRARYPWKLDAAGTDILDSTSTRSHVKSFIRKIRSRSRDRSPPKEKGSTLKDQGKQL